MSISANSESVYKLCKQCQKRSLNGVKDVFVRYPCLNDVIKHDQHVMFWIYYHNPSKDILVYLYQEKEMSITYTRDYQFIGSSNGRYVRAKKQCTFLCLLVMSAPVLELKDFVTYLSDLVTK